MIETVSYMTVGVKSNSTQTHGFSDEIGIDHTLLRLLEKCIILGSVSLVTYLLLVIQILNEAVVIYEWN